MNNKLHTTPCIFNCLVQFYLETKKQKHKKTNFQNIKKTVLRIKNDKKRNIN